MDNVNQALIDWLKDVRSGFNDEYAHIVTAAVVIIECSECGQIYMRGFRYGAEADPEPLLGKAVLHGQHGHRGTRKGPVQ